jgi:hypothetical protein
MALGIRLKANALDQVKLGFEEVDVVLFVLHQALEQIARDGLDNKGEVPVALRNFLINESLRENAKIHYDARGRSVRFKSANICTRGTRPSR